MKIIHILFYFLACQMGPSVCGKQVYVEPTYKIAFAFVGQFMRHSMYDESALNKFGNHSFSAYIATSNWHNELNNDDFVDQRRVCSQIITVGFQRCVIGVEPYNASRFIHEVGDYKFEDGLYAYRLASFFSTISRSIRMIENDEAIIGSPYDAIVVTRLDITHYKLRFQPSLFWGRSLNQYDLVVSLKNPQYIEDRFFYGPRDNMMIFRDLYDNFDRLVRNESCFFSEQCLSFFVNHHQFKRLGRVFDYLLFLDFETNTDKKAENFLERVRNNTNNNHIPWHHLKEMQQEHEEEEEVVEEKSGMKLHIKAVKCTSELECSYGEKVHVIVERRGE